MKSKILLFGVIGAASIMVAACGGSDDSGAPVVTAPPPPTPMSLDTAQVLALAQVTSEKSSPFAVNGGLLTLTDTSETTAPIAVMQ